MPYRYWTLWRFYWISIPSLAYQKLPQHCILISNQITFSIPHFISRSPSYILYMLISNHQKSQRASSSHTFGWFDRSHRSVTATTPLLATTSTYLQCDSRSCTCSQSSQTSCPMTQRLRNEMETMETETKTKTETETQMQMQTAAPARAWTGGLSAGVHCIAVPDSAQRRRLIAYAFCIIS